MEQHPPGSPEWWAYRLDAQLNERQPHLERLDRYYRGDHPLPHIPERAKFKDTYRRLLKESRSNWMRLVVQAVVERLTVQGFRYPDEDDTTNTGAADVWEANDLDVGSEQVHTEALLHGISHVLVSPAGDGPPLITPEHPLQTIVATDPALRRRRLAGWKKWLADDGHAHATLYLPKQVIKLQSEKKVRDGLHGRIRWVPRESEGATYEITNPFGVVPLVPFVNQPGMLRPFGASDIEDLTDTQDRINETIFGRLVASQFSAFRQRYVTGMVLKRDPDTGEVDKPFEPGASEMWATGSKEAKFGEFEQTDLAPYIASVEADIQHLAAQSRTPPHYLLGQSGAFPSGESLAATEGGLVAKVGERQTYFTPAWREVMTIALGTAQGRPKVLWGDPEQRSLAVFTDSLVKLAALGVPREVLWEMWLAVAGTNADVMSEVRRWKSLAAADQLLGLGAALDEAAATGTAPPLAA